jgi:hypothetical protein
MKTIETDPYVTDSNGKKYILVEFFSHDLQDYVFVLKPMCDDWNTKLVDDFNKSVDKRENVSPTN